MKRCIVCLKLKHMVNEVCAECLADMARTEQAWMKKYENAVFPEDELVIELSDVFEDDEEVSSDS